MALTRKRRHRRPNSTGLYVDLSTTQYRAVKRKARHTRQPLKHVVETLLAAWLAVPWEPKPPS